jgi:hypothetical protein
MTAMKLFIGAIVLVGAIRFGLTISGVPDDVTKYASMTVVILVGSIFFAITEPARKERLKSAFLLVLPYMLIEVFAIGYTWASGRPTIFHSPEYNFGTTLPVHLVGHFIGGLTWEPLMVFVTMEIVRGVFSLMRLVPPALKRLN